jgi:hypothetical protein
MGRFAVQQCMKQQQLLLLQLRSSDSHIQP